MKRRTVLLGALKGPWIPVHSVEAELVVSGLESAEVALELRGKIEAQADRITQDGRYTVKGSGWIRAISSVLCPSLVCQLEH